MEKIVQIIALIALWGIFAFALICTLFIIKYYIYKVRNKFYLNMRVFIRFSPDSMCYLLMDRGKYVGTVISFKFSSGTWYMLSDDLSFYLVSRWGKKVHKIQENELTEGQRMMLNNLMKEAFFTAAESEVAFKVLKDNIAKKQSSENA